MTLAPWWPLGRVVPHKLRVLPWLLLVQTNLPHFFTLTLLNITLLLFLLVDCARHVEALTGGLLPL